MLEHSVMKKHTGASILGKWNSLKVCQHAWDEIAATKDYQMRVEIVSIGSHCWVLNQGQYLLQQDLPKDVKAFGVDMDYSAKDGKIEELFIFELMYNNINKSFFSKPLVR